MQVIVLVANRTVNSERSGVLLELQWKLLRLLHPNGRFLHPEIDGSLIDKHNKLFRFDQLGNLLDKRVSLFLKKLLRVRMPVYPLRSIWPNLVMVIKLTQMVGRDFQVELLKDEIYPLFQSFSLPFLQQRH